MQNNSIVDLSIYNLWGQKVKTLIDDYLMLGERKIVWDGTDDSGEVVPTGVYYCLLQTDNLVQSKKMIHKK